MLTEQIDVSHDALDAHPAEFAAGLLRNALTDVGVLGSRQTEWTKYDRWLESFLREQPASITRVLAPYCRWSVSARTRMLIARNGITEGTFSRARSYCRAAAKFLAHVAEGGDELETVSQSVLDEYLIGHSREFDFVRTFIRWAIDTRRALRLRAPKSHWQEPTSAYPIDVYRRWMARFSEDETIPLRARICGLLCGTLGRPSSVIVKLRRSDIVDSGDQFTIKLGKSRVSLRAPLPELIRRQLAAPRRWDTESDWLFPSSISAGNHADPSCFTRDFSAIGCGIVPLRGAAMSNLAATIPVGPLSDLTGVSIQAASRWQTVSASAFSSYPALRL